MRFDLKAIHQHARELTTACCELAEAKAGHAGTAVLDRHRERIQRLVEKLDPMLNPEGRLPEDYTDLDAAELADDVRLALCGLRSGFDKCWVWNLDAKRDVSFVDPRYKPECWHMFLKTPVEQLRRTIVSLLGHEAAELDSRISTAKEVATSIQDTLEKVTTHLSLETSAFRPASEFIDANDKRFDTLKKLRTFLGKNPEIRTRKPRPQRLEIHAGDWMKATARAVSSPDLDIETAGTVVEEAKRRELRKRNLCKYEAYDERTGKVMRTFNSVDEAQKFVTYKSELAVRPAEEGTPQSNK